MKHLFIIDPFSLLQAGHDSSLAMMKEAILLGHKVFQAELKDIFWSDNLVKANTREVKILASGGLISNGEYKQIDLGLDADLAVWMRKDPPVDEKYIQVCQLFRLSKAKVINNPDSLLACDEKLFALEFPDLMPKNIITQSITEIKSLIQSHNQLIAKPIGGKAGEGILLLRHDDKNLSSILELITQSGQRKIILQEYLPSSREGDKRIFLLAGNPIGAILRVPKSDDHRANMAAGGSVQKTNVTEEEQAICNILKPRLLELGLIIVGLDVIGNKLTEINITSPTGLEEIAKLDGTNPAREIMNWSVHFARGWHFNI
ncbi:MAG: glutathione synthase [Candidatus Melainabacteria bacterium]|jgi:glutathione synthase